MITGEIKNKIDSIWDDFFQSFFIPSPQTLKAVITKLDELFENPEVQVRDMLGEEK